MPGRRNSEDPRVLHLHDCARVGATLVAAGRRAGLDWHHHPPMVVRDTGPGPAAFLRRSPDLLRWHSRRLLEVARADVVHVHYGRTATYLRQPPRRPFVLHLHGTDIRTQYLQDRWRPAIQWGAEHASTVWFATPDLAENARRARADAEWFPIPVDLRALPAWTPSEPPVVAFASRWDASKGVEVQLRMATALRRALPPEVDLVGLDWGSGAAQARAAGVRLVPRTGLDGFYRYLAAARVVVGQSSGILATSELEAVATGVPVAMPYDRALYADVGQVDVPVLGGGPDEVVEQVLQTWDDPEPVSRRLGGRSWVERHHDPDRLVAVLRAAYSAAVRP